MHIGRPDSVRTLKVLSELPFPFLEVEEVILIRGTARNGVAKPTASLRWGFLRGEFGEVLSAKSVDLGVDGIGERNRGAFKATSFDELRKNRLIEASEGGDLTVGVRAVLGTKAAAAVAGEVPAHTFPVLVLWGL